MDIFLCVFYFSYEFYFLILFYVESTNFYIFFGDFSSINTTTATTLAFQEEN